MSIEKLIGSIIDYSDTNNSILIINRALTLDGRISLEDSLSSLSSSEKYLAKCAESLSIPISKHLGNFVLAFRPHGRLHFLPKEEFDLNEKLFILLGFLTLTDQCVSEFRQIRLDQHKAIEQDRENILSYFEEFGYEKICRTVSAAVNHMAPLIYYVGDHCVSNFYDIGKSNLPSESTLQSAIEEIKEKERHASIETLTVILCLWLLLRSGANSRAEELNLSQISLHNVNKFFERKKLLYGQINEPDADLKHFDRANLLSKAEILALTREKISKSHRFIRLINGLTLRKKEAILPIALPNTNTSIAPIPQSARAYACLQRWMPKNISIQKLLESNQFEQLLHVAYLPPESSGTFDSFFEYLIDRVISEAVISTNSDIGMSRSARDYIKFYSAIEGADVKTACDWGQSEYFCHVVPSESMVKACAPKVLTMILNSVSARMRYNTWHYAPSYFNTHDVADDRGWFFAPRMADIADFSDYHHTGHVHAQVRFCIRSPLPLRLNEKILPGFIDLRLMRQKGEPYSLEELGTAIAYTEILQFLYQQLMNYIRESKMRFVVSLGEKKWFERAYPTPPVAV